MRMEAIIVLKTRIQALILATFGVWTIVVIWTSRLAWAILGAKLTVETILAWNTIYFAILSIFMAMLPLKAVLVIFTRFQALTKIWTMISLTTMTIIGTFVMTYFMINVTILIGTITVWMFATRFQAFVLLTSEPLSTRCVTWTSWLTWTILRAILTA